MFLTSSTNSTSPKAALRSRSGFSLVELLVVMVMLSIVGGALVATIVRQQRFYRGASEIMDVRSQMRHGIDVLSAELRGISAAGGDIFAGTMTSTSVEFRATIGSAIICDMNGGANQIDIPPNMTLAAGNRLTFLGRRPQAGDGIFILDEGATESMVDDVWQLRNINSVATANDPCAGTPYTGVGDAAKSGLQITFDAPPLPATVVPGTAVRIVQRVRYGLYAAADGRTYLGYCESTSLGTPCATLQPVSGPYRAADANDASGASGLNFYYYDENGNVTADPLLVARIELAIRGVSSNWVSRSGNAASGYFMDTSRVVVGVRNRR
jgi:prepilin-type N-terminal cleavage/methylation domain-containing protein